MPTATKKRQFIDGVKRNSLSHKILLIAKFYRKPVTIKDMAIINPIFNKPGKNNVNRYLLNLELSGFLYRVTDTMWMITPKGESLLYKIVKDTQSMV